MQKMKLWRALMCLLLVAAMIVPLAGCGKKNVKEFSLNCYALTLEEGQNAEIVASVDASLLNWASSNESVATVKNGVVTAVKAGTAEITAESASDKAICRITVTERSNSVPALSVSSDDVTLFVGRQFDLQPVFAVNGVKVEADKYSIDYSMDVDNVVSISNGVVTALDVGTAEVTISVTYGGSFYQKKVVITVCDAENYIELASNKLALCYGKTVSGAENTLQTTADLQYTMYLNGVVQSGKTEGVTFTSTNEGVVKVSSTGKVTATGIGYADIIATFRGESYVVSVTVGTPISSTADLNALSNAYRNAEDKTKAPDLWGSDRIYVLAKDIDFNGASFYGIATACHRNKDGDGYWRTNHEILNPPSSPYSFDGVINGAGHEIKNMVLAPVWAQWNQYFFIGAHFIGYLSGRLENIAFTNLKVGESVSQAIQHCGLISTLKESASLESVYVDATINAGAFASQSGLLANGWEYDSGRGNEISVRNCIVKAHYADGWKSVAAYGAVSEKMCGFIYAPNSNKPANISGCYFISDNISEELLYGSINYIDHIYSSMRELAGEKTVASLKVEGFDKPMIDRIMSAK